jgi:acyl-CoA thioester hydrolase
VARVPEPVVHRLRVRYGECDPQGIVFNANYFAYFDVAHTEFWREAVGPFQELTERGLELVVAEASARFRAPARFDDELAIEVRLVRLGRTSLTTDLLVTQTDGGVVAEGTLRHVILDGRSWAAVPLPDWLREALERRLAAAPNASAG